MSCAMLLRNDVTFGAEILWERLHFSLFFDRTLLQKNKFHHGQSWTLYTTLIAWCKNSRIAVTETIELKPHCTRTGTWALTLNKTRISLFLICVDENAPGSTGICFTRLLHYITEQLQARWLVTKPQNTANAWSDNQKWPTTALAIV